MADTWVSQSGYLTNTELNKEFRKVAQPIMKFRQFCSVRNAFGKRRGESFNWLKVSNVTTPGGQLTETSTYITSDRTLAWGTLSCLEYGLAIETTEKATVMSQFDLKAIIRGNLKDDMGKCLDGLVERQFNSTLLRYVGTSTTGGVVTTNGTATATNTSILNTYHWRKMALELKKRNIPGYDGGNYILIASHEAMEGLMGAMESIYQYSDAGTKRLFEGEVGKYYGMKAIEDGYASRFTYSASARTSTAKSWTQAQSLDAYLFGDETVMEAVVMPEELRVKEETDYGRSHGIAWHFMGGHKIMWDESGAANSRIIKWDSAA